MSMSGYVRRVLMEHINGWPEGFLEKYFGICKDDPIERPEELPWEEHRQKDIDDFVEWPDSLPEDFTPPILSLLRRSPPEE